MKTFLQVPYKEKDTAKALGARWSPAHKLWYVEDVQDIKVFMKWIAPLDRMGAKKYYENRRGQ
jgi:ribonuclease HI